MLRLRDKDRALIQSIADECLGKDVEIWAYGSRVDGSSHEGSDLDLVLRAPNLEKLDLEKLLRFQEKIKKSNIPILVQSFDWARLPESFHKNILRSYEVLKATS